MNTNVGFGLQKFILGRSDRARPPATLEAVIYVVSATYPAVRLISAL
jgi:hypothetical protein